MINKNSPIPIYYQLEEAIKDKIEKGELKPGEALPSEREYAEMYNISRMTVRQAITQLVNSGYIYRLQGKGTFVAERKIEQPLTGLTSFTEDMEARGLTPASQFISFSIIPASQAIASQLSIQEYGPVYEMKRVRLADDVPMALETTYISANLVKGLTEEIASRSFYAYIEEHLKLKIGHASQQIEAASADSAEALHLQIKKGSPILLIQRNTFLEGDVPLEVVKSVYRADRYKFMINMKR
ncbi:GntR family transcriptional regulator [Mesobacillus foraminis]|uniref:GntR family transcriptional regulator n=1 Tax=Mesobacillus foraminis TaxID=279826 RepID=UPI0039A30225